MELKTTTPELMTQLRQGWIGSIALHGLLLLSFLPLFRQSVTAIPKEVFHWNVTLVESTRTADVPAQVVSPEKPAMPSLPKSAPVPAHPIRTVRQATPSAEQIVPSKPSTTEPYAPASQPNIVSPAALPSESHTASRSDRPTSDPPQVSDRPPQAADVPAAPTKAEAQMAQTTEATAADEIIRRMETTQAVQPPVEWVTSEATSPARPDYGWLQQAIFQRLEKLKRSSHPYVGQSQPMKVMVKAVVSREGILLDSMIVKSSGLDRIDQEAMTLVQRAFPMQLDRTLDRQQIVMRIPITYSQE